MEDSPKSLVRPTLTGQQSIEAHYEDETIWLSQKFMANLFNVGVNKINYHLKAVYESSEIQPEATIRKFRIVQQEDSRQVAREVDFYNLDAIISARYRVNSIRATQFRQRATRVLREFAMKGCVLDKRRMGNGAFLGENYYECLLEKIRRSGSASGDFTRKLPTSMPQASITTGTLSLKKHSLPRHKTSCISPSMGTPPPS